MTLASEDRWPLLLFAVLAVLFLWRATLGGQAFVPGGLLRYAAPWADPHGRPDWNPLMYDSVGQFYAWRSFAHDTLRQGTLPLWNPYQFCGAPFVANSQSAVFYPGNLLFWLFRPAGAAGWTVALHLFLAATFMWMLLRRLGTASLSGAMAGIAFAYGTWQVAWLHLPTFLCTSCWLPLVILLTLNLFHAPRVRTALGLGGAAGMALLGGHLQVGFYVLLCACCLAVWLCAQRLAARRPGRAFAGLGLFVLGLGVAAMLAAPQVLPSMELSRRSHRVGTPTVTGYASYTAYAPPAGLTGTALLPDLYGNPSNPDSPYFGTSQGGSLFNYAEGSLYVGLPALLLAAYAVLRRRQTGRLLLFFAFVAVLALALAFATPIDAFLYFHFPGFAQSGSPGRSLVLWSFAVSVLAGLGYDKVLRDNASPLRTAVASIALVLLAGCGCVAFAISHLQAAQEAVRAQAWDPQFARQAGLLLLSAGAMLLLVRRKPAEIWHRGLPAALIVIDLFANGINFNPTVPKPEVYSWTPLIAKLHDEAGHDRIAPINVNWSMAGPTAVLPPNGAMVFGMRDVQGYDSLFPGQYKEFMNRLNGQDSSPLEVGNMVFAKNSASPLLAELGVRFVVTKPDAPTPSLPATVTSLDGVTVYELTGAPGRAVAATAAGPAPRPTWIADTPTDVRLNVRMPADGWMTLADQRYPGWEARVDGRPVPLDSWEGAFRRVRVPVGSHVVAFRYLPAAFRVGLYLALAAFAACLFALSARIARSKGPCGILS